MILVICAGNLWMAYTNWRRNMGYIPQIFASVTVVLKNGNLIRYEVDENEDRENYVYIVSAD